MKQTMSGRVKAWRERKYRAKMVHSKKGWLVKGMVFGTLIFGGGMLTNTQDAQATEWIANSVEQIASRIADGQTSITMIEGDTVYNIGLAINIKDPMKLLYDNGFNDGEQYTLPVGTVISWDGNHVTVTDPQGNVIGDTIVTDDQKHNPNQPVAGQATDTPKNTTQTTNGSPGSQTARPQVPNTGGTSAGNNSSTNPSNPVKPGTPVDPATPSDPEKPTEPTTPTDPEKPVVPEQPDNQTELEKLKALLAELEAKLVVAEQELATAQQNLDAAKAEENIDYDAEIAALQNKIAEKEANKATIENEIATLNTQKATAEAELATAQGTLNSALATQQEAQAAVSAAQDALSAIQETGDAEQIANAEAALQTAQSAYDGTSGQVSQAQAAVNEKQNQVAAVDAQLAAKQAELVNCDTSAELAKIAELETAKQNRPQQSIAELEQIVAEKQKVVDDLKAQIEDVKQQIAAIELKVDRANAINQLKPLEYLTQELVDGYVARINSSLSKGEIDSVVAEAQSENARLQAEQQASQELQTAKDNANQTIANLTYLSENEKSEYTNSINRATTKEEINSIVANAQAANQEAGAAQELEEAKNTAKATLANMNLSEAARNGYSNQVDGANSTDEINTIIAAAQAESDANNAAEAEERALSEAKEAAKVTLNGLNLDAGALTAYIRQVEAAESVDAVNAIVATAQTESDANDSEEQALTAAKQAAQTVLNDLNLSSEALTSYTSQVDAANSVDAVNAIVAAAQAESEANDINDQEALALAEAKRQALETLITYNLSDEARLNYTNQINGAGTAATITNILAEAKAESDRNDEQEPTNEDVYLTVNQDEEGNLLTSTDGYFKISTSDVVKTVETDQNGNTVTTYTTTVTWHKIVNTDVTETVNVDEEGTVLTSTDGYFKLSEAVGEPVVTTNPDNGDTTTTITTTVTWHKIVNTDVTETVNVDEEGTVLTSTDGYFKLSEAVGEPVVTTNPDNGDTTTTVTTTVTWHKIVNTDVHVTVNKDENGATLTSTDGYEQVGEGVTTTTVETAANGDTTTTYTTTYTWKKVESSSEFINNIPKASSAAAKDIEKQVVSDDTAVSLDQAAQFTNRDFVNKVSDTFLAKVQEEQRKYNDSLVNFTTDDKRYDYMTSRAMETLYYFDHSRPSNYLDDHNYSPDYKVGDMAMTQATENIAQTAIRKSDVAGDESKLAELIAKAMFEQFIEDERNAYRNGDAGQYLHYQNIIASGYTDMSIGVFLVDNGSYYTVSMVVNTGNLHERLW